MSPRGRQQMSFGGVPPLTTGAKVLGLATLAVSIFVAVESRFNMEAAAKLVELIGFKTPLFAHFRLWTPFTYTFVNLDAVDVLFSLLGLWMMGGALEQRWGTRRFIIFYLLAGALAALATFVVSLVAPSVRDVTYLGSYGALAACVAAFAIATPDATIMFSFVIPISARLIVPITAGVTVLFMIMRGWQPYLPQLFGLGAGIVLAGGVSPAHFMLRARVWLIDRRLRRSKLRIVRGVGSDEKPGARGSDKYLH